jgi:hypothetical protein
MKEPVDRSTPVLHHTQLMETSLPDGWAIAEYAGRGGKPYYAVYSNGRRMASGMTNARSAARWAHMLAASQRWSAA